MSSDEVTRLLRVFANGDVDALNELLPIVYSELRRIAHRELRRERDGHTLNTTALVHEAYLKLVRTPPSVDWNGRAHFFSVAARAMRQVLVNYAKARAAEKRGGGVERISFDEAVVLPDERAEELVALDDALTRLEAMSARQVRVVECRYFAGLTIEETSDALGISTATANRDWTTAKMWLYREVGRELGLRGRRVDES